MKDSEFIQLLNLYLDHEISAADAARLETEVQVNPARRKVYQQYCRMQKACKALAADFTTAESGSATEAEKKVVAFDAAVAAAAAEKRQRVRGLYSLGSLAAVAACVAFVLVNRGTPDVSTVPEVVAESAVVPSAATTSTTPAAVVTPSPTTRGGIVSVAGDRVTRPRMQPSLVSEQLFLSNTSTNALLTASVQDSGNQLAWIPNLQLAPLSQRIPAEELRFDARPATLRPEVRRFGGPQAQPGAEIEMAAFRFMR